MRALLTSAVCLSLLAGAANAATIYYGEDDGVGAGGARPGSDAAQALFLAAAGTVSPVIDFEGLALGYSPALALAPFVDVGFTGAAPGFSGVSSEDTTEFGYNTTAGGSQHLKFATEFGSPGALTFSFLAPISSFGAFITGVESDLGSITVTSSDGSVTDYVLPGSVRGGGVLFFGLTGLSSVTSLTFTNVPSQIGRDLVGFDDIYYSAAVVPEPMTWALMILGMGGAGAVLRTRRRTALA